MGVLPVPVVPMLSIVTTAMSPVALVVLFQFGHIHLPMYPEPERPGLFTIASSKFLFARLAK
jgi:hypothetical protein